MLCGTFLYQTLHPGHDLNPTSPGTASSAHVDPEAEISEICLIRSFSPWQGDQDEGVRLLLRMPKEVVCETSPSSF